MYDSIPLCSNSQKTVAVNTSMGSCWCGDFTITYTSLFGYVWNRKVSVHANHDCITHYCGNIGEDALYYNYIAMVRYLSSTYHAPCIMNLLLSGAMVDLKLLTFIFDIQDVT